MPFRIGDRSQLAWSEPAQAYRTVPNPDQSQDWMADCAVEAAHLVVSTLANRDETPLTRVHIASSNIVGKIVVTVNAASFDRPRPPVGKANASTQTLELCLPHRGTCGGSVRASQSCTRVRQRRHNTSLLCEKQETFTLTVQSSN